MLPKPKPKAETDIFLSIAKGGRYERRYTIFTWVASASAGLITFLFGVPETYENGKEHALTDAKRFLARKRDEFFDIKPSDYMEKSSIQTQEQEE